MTRLHTVLMDHRERQSQLAEFIAGDPQWQAGFAHMAVGDYLIDGRILIERKSLVDLAASIKDGRLFRQSIRLAVATRKGTRLQRRALMERDSTEGEAGLAENSSSVDAEMQAHGTSVPTGILQCGLLIEGNSSDLRASAMSANSIRAALATVSMFIGIPVLRSGNARESAGLLLSIARQRCTLAYGALPRTGARPKGKRGLQLHLLQGLPGVGAERAARLLMHFGDVRSVMSADETALRSVRGIGPESAKRIVWSLREERLEYLGR